MLLGRPDTPLRSAYVILNGLSEDDVVPSQSIWAWSRPCGLPCHPSVQRQDRGVRPTCMLSEAFSVP